MSVRTVRKRPNRTNPYGDRASEMSEYPLGFGRSDTHPDTTSIAVWGPVRCAASLRGTETHAWPALGSAAILELQLTINRLRMRVPCAGAAAGRVPHLALGARCRRGMVRRNWRPLGDEFLVSENLPPAPGMGVRKNAHV
jgi:hypothetical protein